MCMFDKYRSTLKNEREHNSGIKTGIKGELDVEIDTERLTALLTSLRVYHTIVENSDFKIKVHSKVRNKDLQGRSKARGNIVFKNALPNETVIVYIENIGKKIWNVQWDNKVKRIKPNKKVECSLTVSRYDHTNGQGKVRPLAYVIICPPTVIPPKGKENWRDSNISYTIQVKAKVPK